MTNCIRCKPMARLSQIISGVKALASLISNLVVDNFEVEEDVILMTLTALHLVAEQNE